MKPISVFSKNIFRLTDSEIAFLMYAVERMGNDEMRNYRSKFLDTAEAINESLSQEYYKRKLHWKMFIEED